MIWAEIGTDNLISSDGVGIQSLSGAEKVTRIPIEKSGIMCAFSKNPCHGQKVLDGRFPPSKNCPLSPLKNGTARSWLLRRAFFVSISRVAGLDSVPTFWRPKSLLPATFIPRLPQRFPPVSTFSLNHYRSCPHWANDCLKERIAIANKFGHRQPHEMLKTLRRREGEKTVQCLRGCG
jgi:hypothetical protein